MLKIGDQAPQFTLPDASETPVSLEDFRGKWVILYFYPKDNTSGCTLEALDFTAALPEFEKLNAVVIGVSPDSCKSHQNFMQKHQLKVLLLSDTEHQVLEAYGAWQLKRMYGREYMGVVRSTFLIDPEGVIRHMWNKVKVKGHVEEVLQKLKELQG
ncbi:MAG: thioredoxin-dependent thiol peroxidase [Calditrichaeota bacterium]|nr:MAG: thioredoxin-dependent thiol peroxidase [Calditrichota bacterium]